MMLIRWAQPVCCTMYHRLWENYMEKSKKWCSCTAHAWLEWKSCWTRFELRECVGASKLKMRELDKLSKSHKVCRFCQLLILLSAWLLIGIIQCSCSNKKRLSLVSSGTYVWDQVQVSATIFCFVHARCNNSCLVHVHHSTPHRYIMDEAQM